MAVQKVLRWKTKQDALGIAKEADVRLGITGCKAPEEGWFGDKVSRF